MKIHNITINRHILTIILVSIVVILLGVLLYAKLNGPKTKPPIKYSSDAQDKLLDKVKNKTALSDSDMLAKSRILAVLPQGNESGVVHQEPTFRIEYVKSADAFLVEILDVDITKVKTNTNDWLLSQGMTQDGICNAPVQFWINEQVAQILKKADFTFTPLPPNC
jgi:hypothetical protein